MARRSATKLHAPETATLTHLNAAQREAVTHEGGPLLVIAGAGTGKTAVITERIAWLIREKHERPDGILALTFTEKAAAEMEERVDRLLPMGYSQVWISTFHGFCERVLRDAALEIGLDPSFRVLSVPEQWLLMRRHLYSLPLQYFRPLGNPTKFLRALVRVISAAKDQDLPPEKFASYAKGKDDLAERAAIAGDRDALREEAVRWKEFADLYRAYNAILVRESAMDFGDLILNVLHLFRERPSVLKRYREQFRAVLIDEFQDTNGAQNELINLLVGEEGNVTVVGDDDQSIYAWRGSNITNILNFERTYPRAKHVVLTENYRSPQELLDAAYTLIQHNNPLRLEKTADVVKRLRSARPRLSGASGEHISHRQFTTVEQESAFVAETIIHLVEKNVCSYRDIAILTRTNAQMDDLVPSLVQRDIPFHIAEARGLLLRPEIRDIAAYLRVILNPTAAIPLFRLLALPMFALDPFERQGLIAEAKRKNRGLLDAMRKSTTLAFLSPDSQEGIRKIIALLDHDVARAAKTLPSRVIWEFLQKSGYLDLLLKNQQSNVEALPNITEFLNFVKEYERTEPDASLAGFVEFLDLVIASGDSPSQATLPQDVDAVHLMTVHGAKGLEFPVVFLPGATQDKYPIRDRTDPLELPEEFAPRLGVDPRDAHILEERRLFYVAMTRAKERLFITSAERAGSQKLRKKPSPFLREAEIPTVEQTELSQGQQLMLPITQAPPRAAPKAMLTLPKSLSVSQVETYETCPLKYQYQYVFRVPAPPSHAITFGVTMHAVLRDLAQLVLHGKRQTLEDARALYERHWNSEGFENEDQERQQRERGRELLAKYLDAHPELLSRLPLFIEQAFRFRVGPVTVDGRIDRVDKKDENTVTVTDFKTGQSKEQKEADRDLQLSVYAMALKDVFHLHADRLTLSYLGDTVDRHTTREKADLAKAKERLLAAAEGIRAQEFPAKPSVHTCGFCDFRTICDFSAV